MATIHTHPIPSSPLPLPLLFLLLFLFYAPFSDASVHDYNGERFAGMGNAFILHGGSEGLYASVSNPNSTEGSNGDSFIRFDKLTFKRPETSNESAKGSDSVKVHAIIFEVEDREMIGGSAYGGQRAICCTPDLAKLGACTQGAVIYRPSTQNPDWPQVLVASFTGNDLTATLPSRTVPITRTGMYNMYFIHCDPSLNGLEIEGKTIWKNPTGYLPGRMAPLMNFYGFMSFAFAILGIFWFSQYARPTLGGLTSKVIMLGGTFFLASEILELVENVGAISDLSGKARLFLVLPVALLDAFFIIWIFTSLSKTLDKLQARRLMVKLDIYRKFTNALAVAVIVSVGWTCYELYFKSSDVFNERWQRAWIIPAFWQVLSFSLLCVICALWAPSQNSMRYAYSDDASEDFDREDTLSLIKPGPIPPKDGRSFPASLDTKTTISVSTPISHDGMEVEDKRE
uniref:GOST seven transmembrane domain-containing protein n=1 Tax=Ananas comosus var. bracteatus TaxID=296719 RepID=A0A6V7P984_ANACO|nr:unnamed protein product [Ananas comosus var. bracteatus]